MLKCMNTKSELAEASRTSEYGYKIAYNLPIFTIVTKVDCIQRGKIQKVIADVKKEFGGDVLPFSSENRFYCENTIEYLINLSKQ